MNQPSLYSRASSIQRHDAKEIVKEYADFLELGSGGKQSLLDVGSGSGDVLMEIVAPSLARGFKQITGVDVSPKMVEHSKKCYADKRGVDFKELDFGTDKLPLEFHEQFDRVTSFYSLHWIQNYRKCLENVFNCLRPNGDCLLVFIGSHTVYDAYRALSRDPRMKQYVAHPILHFNPLLDHPHIGDMYEAMLEDVGFVEQRVEVKKKTFHHDGRDNFKNNMRAIHPLPLSDAEFEEYFDAFCDFVDSKGLMKRISGSEDHRFFVKYRLVVVYAKKGEYDGVRF